MKTRSAPTFRIVSALLTTRPGPTPRICMIASSQTIAMAIIDWLETVSVRYGSGIVHPRRGVGRPGGEALQIERNDHRAGGNRAGEPGDERRPSGQESGEAAIRFAQVDVLASRARPQRGQLRIGHRATEREQPARNPGREEQPGVRGVGGDAGREEENASPDDVRHDDRRRVERPEPPLEPRRVRRRYGSG